MLTKTKCEAARLVLTLKMYGQEAFSRVGPMLIADDVSVSLNPFDAKDVRLSTEIIDHLSAASAASALSLDVMDFCENVFIL